MLRTMATARGLMMRRFLNPTALARASSTQPSPSSSSSDVVSTTAADVADVVGDDDEEDDPLYSGPADSASSSLGVKPVMPTLLQPRVVVYDGVCHLCHRGVKWVIKADKHRKIKFCCLQSQTAEPYLRLCGVDREDVLRRFLFVEGPGFYHHGSTAALKVLSYLPLPYSALSMLMVVPTPLRDAIYDHVAKRRYDWFGKAEDCLVMKERELLERFIDREEMMGSDGSGSTGL
ncbi:hypothetical protein FNV43_RR13876 [Rhamnella rubrinervis]|uniref:Thiol-disulfide oxidoreductase DCC n=1 Tax=Rhamnella rubrinervis TaxID=2594499 RepID=A0A8K0MFN3_9ROSA|nr:hypothetical protein FNV43_RR13876 [Rhamnella rubrinervis]